MVRPRAQGPEGLARPPASFDASCRRAEPLPRTNSGSAAPLRSPARRGAECARRRVALCASSWPGNDERAATRAAARCMTACAGCSTTDGLACVGRLRQAGASVVPRPTSWQCSAHAGSSRALVREARRLKSVVVELLEAARIEPFTGPPERQEVNLAALACELCAGRRRCRVEALEALMGGFEGARMRQLLGHLLDNALAYD